ncbi:HD domain-containing protein, partial [Acinetobacter nosocomialis]|uniref:HD domain-containing protein n=1 Tax=Acinetobacter nosocomialis TaxID=106654 RepID=UPI0013D73D94
EDAELLLVAAWLHDAGYIEGDQNHEKRSATIAEAFLKDNNFSEEKIEKVKSFILATEMSREPETLLQKIMRDADCSHFGDANYFN